MHALLSLQPVGHGLTHLLNKYLLNAYYEPGRPCSRLWGHRSYSEETYSVVEDDDEEAVECTVVRRTEE